MSAGKTVTGNYSLSATSNVSVTSQTFKINGNLELTGSASLASANLNVQNITAAGNVVGATVSSTGNVTGALFIGDGSGLTGIAAGNALGNIISFGTSQVAIPQLSGNVFVNVAGVSNIAVFSGGGANVAGFVNATGNLSGANVVGGAYYWANGQPLTGSVKYNAQSIPPGGPSPGDFWFNTSNGITYQYNNDGDTNQWIDVSGIGTPGTEISAVANSVVQRDTNASTTANIMYGAQVITTGNITTSAGYFIGNGSFLTGVATSVDSIFNGPTSMAIPSSGGNILANVNGVPILGITSDGIINNLGNGIGNIGNSFSYFNTVFAKSTSAQYADLAEIYSAEQNYDPGTVLVFGGSHEVTTTNVDHNPKAAGVVSTNPAHLMNSTNQGVAVALTGRVPCYVQGPISKGDLLVTSNKPGIAQACVAASWVPGCTLGKSLEDITDDSIKLIEVAVGRY
jgi:hypothetical protein